MVGSRYRAVQQLDALGRHRREQAHAAGPPPISTSLATRSGQLKVKATALWPPIELPSRWTLSIPS